MAPIPYGHEINGEAAKADALASLATFNFGHFTSMQVRRRAVRGLDLHYARLDAATHELFEVRLTPTRVRKLLRHALRDVEDASVRISVFSAAATLMEAAESVDVLISVSPPRQDGHQSMRVGSVVHKRYLPHLKHVGTFPLIDHGRRVRDAGYDDALFVDASGQVSEGTIWNIALFDGTEVVWPDAPKLVGITMQLVMTGLEHLGTPQSVRPVRLAELSQYTSAVTCYSIGAGRRIGSIDDHIFSEDEMLSRIVARAYASNPFQPI